MSSEQASAGGRTLARRDVVASTVIALLMVTAFTRLSSGSSLLVTFVPGVAIAWLLMVWMYVRRIALPEAQVFLPPYFAVLAIQFLHFAEEFVTGFPVRFPALYGGAPYTLDTFVLVNMVSYAVFALCALAVFHVGRRWLIFPVLFFIVYGVIGNAVSHSWWGLRWLAYFPGLYTAQLYWIAGPLLLWLLTRRRRAAALVVAGTALVLVPLLAAFATT